MKVEDNRSKDVYIKHGIICPYLCDDKQECIMKENQGKEEIKDHYQENYHQTPY